MNAKHIVVCFIIAILSFTFNTVAFADDSSSSVSQSEARKMNRVMKGLIIQASDVTIEAKSDAENTGAAAGTAIGLIAGSNFGSGKGSIVGSIAGAVVGGIAGKISGSLFGKQSGQDLVIQLFGKDGQEGEIVDITQAVDDKAGKFTDGDAILVVYKGENARVIRQASKKVAAAAE